MSAPSTSGLSVELLLRVIDVKYGCFTFLLFFTLLCDLRYGNRNWKLSIVENSLCRCKA